MDKEADTALLASLGYTADDAWHIGVMAIVEAMIVSGKWRAPVAELDAYLERRRADLEACQGGRDGSSS